MNWKLTLFLLAVVAWYFIMKAVNEVDKKKKEEIEKKLEEFTQEELRTVYWWKDFNPQYTGWTDITRKDRIRTYRNQLEWPMSNRFSMTGSFDWKYQKGTMDQVPECYDMYSDELYVHNRARLKHMWIKDLYQLNKHYQNALRVAHRTSIRTMVNNDTKERRQALARLILDGPNVLSQDEREEEVLEIYSKYGIKPEKVVGKSPVFFANKMGKHAHCEMCTKEKRDWARANGKCDNPSYEEPKIER